MQAPEQGVAYRAAHQRELVARRGEALAELVEDDRGAAPLAQGGLLHLAEEEAILGLFEHDRQL